MSTVTINDIERDPIACIARARAGEVLLIVDNDRPVAELKGVGNGAASPVDQFLYNRVADAKVPLPWKEEGTVEPTIECRDMALQVARTLYLDHGLIPHRVVASRVGGIFLSYQRNDAKRTLGVEIDNDLDVVGVVSDTGDVLASGVFEGDGAIDLLKIFHG